MLLTAGTFLQEGRYWVEGILEQDETGISYRAQHRNLDIPVVIQTFAPSWSDRPDVSQLLQSFMAEVRCQSLAPSSEKPFRVLDCFIEFSQPFVVLEMAADAKPPSVATTWLPGLGKPVQEEIIQDKTVPDEAVPDKATQDNLNGEAAVPPAKQLELVTTPSTLEAPAGVPTNGNTSKTRKDNVTAATQVVASTPTKNGTKPSSTRVVVSTSMRRSPRWLPISLGLTAVIGGCTGAVFGWQLRQGKSLSEVVPVVGPKVDVDQSFPPIDGWPASEASDIPGSGTSLDQVLQRQTPAPKTRRRRVVEEPPIEPYQIDYGSDTATRAEPYREPDYNSGSFDDPAPVNDYQEETPTVAEPAAVSEPEPSREETSPPAAVSEQEPAPIEKPVVPPPETAVSQPPESAAPRSSRIRPQPPAAQPSADAVPPEAMPPQ